MEQEHYVFPQEEEEPRQPDRACPPLSHPLTPLVFEEAAAILCTLVGCLWPEQWHSLLEASVVIQGSELIYSVLHLRKRKAEKKQQPK